jgi:ribonuclease P/MRP protein subunit POP5
VGEWRKISRLPPRDGRLETTRQVGLASEVLNQKLARQLSHLGLHLGATVKMVRTKERYLAVHIIYPTTGHEDVPEIVARHRPTTENITSHTLSKGIRAAVSRLYGDVGRAACEYNLHVKYWSRATSTLIVRTSRSHYKMIWAGLNLMNRVPTVGQEDSGSLCKFAVVRVCGTMRKAEQEIIRQDRQLIFEAQARMSVKTDNAASRVPSLDAMAIDIEDDSEHDAEQGEESEDDSDDT